jgi:hypothetical protein
MACQKRVQVLISTMYVLIPAPRFDLSPASMIGTEADLPKVTKLKAPSPRRFLEFGRSIMVL